MDFNHSVHDGDVPVPDLENKYFPSLHWVLMAIGEEQQIPSVECRFHTTTEEGREGGR